MPLITFTVLMKHQMIFDNIYLTFTTNPTPTTTFGNPTRGISKVKYETDCVTEKLCQYVSLCSILSFKWKPLAHLNQSHSFFFDNNMSKKEKIIKERETLRTVGKRYSVSFSSQTPKHFILLFQQFVVQEVIFIVFITFCCFWSSGVCIYIHSRNKVVSCVAPMYIPLVGQCVCDICSPVRHKNTQEVHFSQGSNSNVQGKRGQLCALAAPVIEYSLQTRTRQSFNVSKA